MLFKLSFKSTVLLTMLGLSYHAYEEFFDNIDSQLIPPYGFIILIIMCTFWAFIWCITPSRYWED